VKHKDVTVAIDSDTRGFSHLDAGRQLRPILDFFVLRRGKR